MPFVLRLRRLISWLLLLGILAVIIILLIDFYIEKTGNKYLMEPEDVPQVDAIIVLGAYVFPDGTVSEMLADRLDVGLKLYNANKSTRIVVSGDHGRKEYDEVNAMREYLQSKGVPREAIFMDHAGFDTYNSLYRARDIFQIKKAILVSQGYHLKRALYISRKLGIEGYGVPSDKYEYPGMKYYRIREVGARFKAFLQAGIFKPEPKYLGETIPIWKSGELTDDGKS